MSEINVKTSAFSHLFSSGCEAQVPQFTPSELMTSNEKDWSSSWDRSLLLERLQEASRKNKEGSASSSAHSWEPAAGEPKRSRSESHDEDKPNAKRMKIKVADASADQVDKSGNAVGSSAKWVLQEDPCALGHPVTQAMWLVVEKSYDYYSGHDKAWFRPATQLSDLLEAQFQANVGCQTCVLEYPKEGSESVKHFFEHDLRGNEWVQRRFNDEGKTDLKSSKQLLRVMIG